MKIHSFIQKITPFAIFFLLSASLSQAEQGQQIEVELNNAQQEDSVCRLSFMIRNALPQTVGELSMEIVLLDTQGLARTFMILRSGQLTAGKRRIHQFDLPDTSCSELGEILINDVADCQGDSLSPASCLKMLSASSRTQIKLGL